MAYDSAVISFTTKTDKVDLVQAAHMNDAQSEIVRIETILGTNVKGDRADLKTRLNNALDADGSLLSGTSFPSPALPSQPFVRTDLDVFYVRNAANDEWLAQGGSFSNVVFYWMGVDDTTASAGLVRAANLTTGYSAKEYYYFSSTGVNYITILTGKFLKISGISTLTLHAKLWAESADSDKEAYLKALVNTTLTGEVHSTTTTTPAWVSSPVTIDVSSLTNGTWYDLEFQIKCESNNRSYCSAIILTGS